MFSFLPSTKGFLGLSAEEIVHAPESAQAYILPYGLEASVSYKPGTKRGPDAIIAASHEVELFDESFWCEPYRQYGVATLVPEAIPACTLAVMQELKEKTQHVLRLGKFPLFLGGEHAITAGIMDAVSAHFPEVVIFHFDAHADLRDGYDGLHYSHAAALRRCLDYSNVSIVSFGIRNISSEEVEFLNNNQDRVNIFWAKDKAQWDMNEIASLFKGKMVYLSFDVDAFDSSVMPATGTPEPGGLYWDEVIGLIELVSSVSNIIGADICELSPQKSLHACDFLAAKLAYKILSYSLIEK